MVGSVSPNTPMSPSFPSSDSNSELHLQIQMEVPRLIPLKTAKSKSAPIFESFPDIAHPKYIVSLKPPTPTSSSPLSDLEKSINMENAFEIKSKQTNHLYGALSLVPISSVQEVDDYGDDLDVTTPKDRPHWKSMHSIEEIDDIRITQTTLSMPNTHSNLSAYSALSPTRASTVRSVSSLASSSTLSHLSSAVNLSQTVIVKETLKVQRDEEIEIGVEDATPSDNCEILSIDTRMDIMKKSSDDLSSRSHSHSHSTPPTPESPNSTSMDSNSDHFDRMMKSIDDKRANYGVSRTEATLSNATVTDSHSQNNEQHTIKGVVTEHSPDPHHDVSCACIVL